MGGGTEDITACSIRSWGGSRERKPAKSKPLPVVTVTGPAIATTPR